MLLVIKYFLFALIATVMNVLFQDAVHRLYHGTFEIYASMITGTLAGLIVKYTLDKRYIFAFHAESLMQDGQRFIFYSLMGVLTTGIFWGAEMTFDYVFKTTQMRYVGAVLGLSIGYFIKYHLDKRFVFAEYA